MIIEYVVITGKGKNTGNTNIFLQHSLTAPFYTGKNENVQIDFNYITFSCCKRTALISEN